MQITRRWLAILVGGGLVLAACSGAADEAADKDKKVVVDEDTGDGGVVIQSEFATAAASTADAGSARMEMTIDMTVPGAGPTSITAEGVTDFATGNTQMTMDMSAMLEGLGGALDGMTGDDGFVLELRLVDGVMYMHYPEFMASFMGDKSWIAVDMSDALAEAGATSDLSGPFGQANPKQYLDYLATASSGVEEIGTETVRDVETTHYKATIDLTKAIDQTSPELMDKLGLDADEYSQQLDEMRAMFGDGMPVDVWIDGDGLLRKMVVDMSLSAEAAGAAMTMTMEMFDYGVDVDVQAPPADEVGDMSSLTDGLGDLGSGTGGFGPQGIAA